MDLEGLFTAEDMEEADTLVRDFIRHDAWLRGTVESVAQPQLGHQIVVTVSGPDVAEVHLQIVSKLAAHALAGAVAVEGHGGGGLAYD